MSREKTGDAIVQPTLWIMAYKPNAKAESLDFLLVQGKKGFPDETSVAPFYFQKEAYLLDSNAY